MYHAFDVAIWRYVPRVGVGGRWALLEAGRAMNRVARHSDSVRLTWAELKRPIPRNVPARCWHLQNDTIALIPQQTEQRHHVFTGIYNIKHR